MNSDDLNSLSVAELFYLDDNEPGGPWYEQRDDK